MQIDALSVMGQVTSSVTSSQPLAGAQGMGMGTGKGMGKGKGKGKLPASCREPCLCLPQRQPLESSDGQPSHSSRTKIFQEPVVAEEHGNYISANCRIKISLREWENKGYLAIFKTQILKPLGDIHLKGI